MDESAVVSRSLGTVAMARQALAGGRGRGRGRRRWVGGIEKGKPGEEL